MPPLRALLECWRPHVGSSITYVLPILAIAFGVTDILAEQYSNHPDQLGIRDPAETYEHLVERYLPDFLGIDRGLIGRADDDIKSLLNNVPNPSNIEPGHSQYWSFPKSGIQRRKSTRPSGLPFAFQECPDRDWKQPEKQLGIETRQDAPNLFISLNTCDQPSPRKHPSNGAPDQLKLYVSTSSGNRKPDAGKHDHAVSVDGGYGSISLAVSGDVYIGVFAPTSEGLSGIYNYEIAASIDDYYAKYSPQSTSRFIDSDRQSALIYTNSTTNCNASHTLFHTWQSRPPPFSIFVSVQDDPGILGLQNSMCGLKKHSQVQGTTSVDRDMTLSGGGLPKQQFYIKELNASSSYYAVIGLEGTDGNSTSIGGGKVNGGGTIWAITNFTTKSSPNCALIYNLDFCSEVAYAVPSNSTNPGDLPNLRATYDSNAVNLYKNFNKSLQQIPCNTTDSARYSLAVNCTDCAAAYRNWLCAVTIPRCEDFSSSEDYLLARSVGSNFIDQTYGRQFDQDYLQSPLKQPPSYMNSSRNPLIDNIIRPGPYKELLPCEDLCYGLVRSCPAALGFSCPLEGHGLNNTYGKFKRDGRDRLTCNAPGVDTSAASSVQSPILVMVTMAIGMMLWLLLT